MLRPFILLTVALVLLSACRSILGGDTHVGTFTAEITGSINARLEGTTRAEKPNFIVGGGYGISMIATDGRGVFLRSRSKPRVGTYEVKEFSIGTPAEGFEASFLSTPNGGSFLSTSGEVRITVSARNRLAGTFDFRGTAGLSDDSVRVTGSFIAR